MSLVTVDLPSPDEMRPLWAASSAVLAALGLGDDTSANGSQWRYHDGGGNWAQLMLLGDGRALLIGHDHEYSETYFGAAADYFEEPETDLLAGAPDWWAQALQMDHHDEWIGWIYAWDGGSWHRAAYDATDGFDDLNLPARSTRAAHDFVRDLVEGASSDAGVDADDDEAAVGVLLSAGAALTPEQLAAVFGPAPADLEAGVAAARRFAEGAQPDPVAPWHLEGREPDEGTTPSPPDPDDEVEVPRGFWRRLLGR